MSNENRLFHIVAIADKTGCRTQLTAAPMSHHDCCVMMSKQSDATRARNRVMLEEVISPAICVATRG